MTSFGPSEMWRRIGAEMEAEFTGDPASYSIHSLNRFIAVWNPATSGLRYAKTALYLAATQLTARQIEILRAVGPRRLSGGALEVTVAGERINFDYLSVALEVDFMRPLLETATSVMEIGAGYGRTCHGVLKAFPNVRRYVIVDLAPCLALSRAYLRRVLTDAELARVEFRANDDIAGWVADMDLAINIDSMAGMDEPVIRNYFAIVDGMASGFYCKNPVGKYDPSVVGVEAVDSPAVAQALKTGLMREVVDIFDADQVAAKADEFVAAYRPSDAWRVLAHSPAPPWSFYHQALYRRGR